MSVTDQDLTEALKNCSRDPIHIPGAVQSFGVLMATDPTFERIQYVSNNIDQAQSIVGAPVESFFSSEERHAVRNVLNHNLGPTERKIIGAKTIEGASHLMSLHQTKTDAIIEFVPEFFNDASAFRTLEKAHAVLTAPLDPLNLDDFLEDMTGRLRDIVSYDRVMFYYFLPDGTGEVRSEARNPAVKSFLGLRFPGSDIPDVARKLYAKTPIRLISDVAQADTPLLSVEEKPLDMSLALLRGKDAVHTQYLRNMKVGGTLTVPLVVDGVLWGLFACHHSAPKVPDPSVLSAAELAGRLVSQRVQQALETRRHTYAKKSADISSRLVIADDSQLAATEYWVATREAVAALVPCDGVVFSVDGRVNSHGVVPPLATCNAMLSLAKPEDDKILALTDLQDRLPDGIWGDTGGALILALPGRPDIRIAYLRKTVRSTVNWAGRPEKDVVVKHGVPRLNPRTSFELYQQSVSNKSDPWSAADIEAGTALRRTMMEALETQRNLRENRHRLGLLVRELNHRVRNILSLVQSLSLHSKGQAESVEAYAKLLENRIIALSGAHNLVIQGEMKGALINDMLDLAFQPYNQGQRRARCEGPDIGLRMDACSVMALLFHELATNSAKYGALSTLEGRVNVSWSLDEHGIEILWTESGGPPVKPPERTGFGTTLIRDGVPYELKGEATLTFDPSGLQARFVLPAELATELPAPHLDSFPPRSPRSDAAPQQLSSLGQTALVVEDNYVVAMLTKKMLMSLGFAEVDTASDVIEALCCLDQKTYGFCVLDVNLNGKYSTRVARKLELAGIPFVFATGYGADAQAIVESYHAPVLTKPLDPNALKEYLNGASDTRKGS